MEKIYLITGASSEVGMSYIERIIENNQSGVVIAVYRSMSEKLQKLALVNDNVKVIPIQTDLSLEQDVEKLISRINETGYKPTHILHLAASCYELRKIKQWDEKQVKEDMQIGVFSFARICKEYLPVMAKNKYGKVVAMLSAVTLGTPAKFTSQYSTVKYALMGFMRSAAVEYADKGLNINAVSPNMMETKFLKNIDERVAQMAAQNSAKGRNVLVRETVDAIDFLLSDRASYINGENLNLSGGDYM